MTTPVRTASAFILACTLTGLAQAAPAASLPGCSTPVPGIVSCAYVLKTFGGRALPQALPSTTPSDRRVMQLIGGALRLSSSSARLGSGRGTYSLEWSWLDPEKNLKNKANDVGNYTTDAAGRITLTSVAKTVYTGVLKDGVFSLTGVPMVAETFEGPVALKFAVK